MTRQEKEKIFREMQLEYHVADAVRQVNDFLYVSGIDPDECEMSFDYLYLAEKFEEEKDCNIPDNDTWQNLIMEYVKANGR